MSDARDAFQNLQVITGRGFDETTLYTSLDEVERRIARHRSGRVVLSSVAALAVVGGVSWGAMSMPWGGNVDPVASPTATTPSASPSPSPTPPATVAAAISVFGEPYPDGAPAPDLVSLLTGGEGGTYLSEMDTTYIFGLLRPDPTDGHTVEVPITFSKGDILVLAAIHWQCEWITEYVRSTAAGDAGRAATAVAELNKFPDLAVIQKYNPKLGESVREDLNLRIIGDTEFAKRWLKSSCSGM